MENLNNTNERILHIEIDNIPEVNTFVQNIKTLTLEEKINKVSDFIKSQFKNAISPHNKNLPQEEKDKIKIVLK